MLEIRSGRLNVPMAGASSAISTTTFYRIQAARYVERLPHGHAGPLLQ